MSEQNYEPIKSEPNRKPDGTFGPGNNANPLGRPKGKTLKEYQAEIFRQMSDIEKAEWLKDVNKDTRWKMSEGLPSQTTDITSGGKPLYIPAELLTKNKLDDTSSEPESDSV